MDISNLKKIKLLGKLVIWTHNNKFFVKDLDKPEEHGTVGFYKNGIIDLHRKNEKNNTYQSLGIIDMKKFLSRLSQDPLSILSPLIEIADSVKIVTFEEKELSHLTVGIFPSLDSISTTKKKKNILEIPEDAINIFTNLEKLQWYDCKNKKVDGGFVYNNDNLIGALTKSEKGDNILILMNEKTLSIKEKLDKTWFPLEPTNWKPDKK